jgi:hypothetical protein
MPSLFTHLILAEESVQALAESETRDLLRSHSHYFYLGCLAPDFPYFGELSAYRGLNLGRTLTVAGNQMEAALAAWLFDRNAPAEYPWAARWHGPAASAWLDLWLPWVWDQEGPQDPKRKTAFAAFLLGMKCHVLADQCLHPKVEADTGDQTLYRSRIKHRRLETALDCLLLRKRGYPVDRVSASDLLCRWIAAPLGSREFFPTWLADLWCRVSAQASNALVDKLELQRWLLGFERGLALLDHPLSPLAAARRDLDNPAWLILLENSGYLDQHLPAAQAACTALLEGHLPAQKVNLAYAS